MLSQTLPRKSPEPFGSVPIRTAPVPSENFRITGTGMLPCDIFPLSGLSVRR